MDGSAGLWFAAGCALRAHYALGSHTCRTALVTALLAHTSVQSIIGKEVGGWVGGSIGLTKGIVSHSGSLADMIGTSMVILFSLVSN